MGQLKFRWWLVDPLEASASVRPEVHIQVEAVNDPSEQIESMTKMPESRVLPVADRRRWTRECAAKLERATAIVEMRTGHRIRLIPWEPAGGFQICEGLLFVDRPGLETGNTPFVEVDGAATDEQITLKMLGFVEPLEAARRAREEQAAEVLVAQARTELSAKEWRAFEIAKRTWKWTREEWMMILTRGLKLAREESELVAVEGAMRDSRQGRFGWRKIRDDLWAEFNR